MSRRVLLHPDFFADLNRQIGWLARNGETSWIERIEADLSRVTALLDRYPGAGMVAERAGPVVLRRVIFPSTPYIAWYVYDESRPRADIMLVRLYHSHQRRPRPDPLRWLPPRGDQE